MQKFQAQLEPNVFHRFLVSDASVIIRKKAFVDYYL